MQTLDPSLTHQPFLADLTLYQLEQVAHCTTPVSFPTGQYIFHAGDDAAQFYILLTGSVAVEAIVPDHAPINIQTLGPGEVLGWSWFYPPYRWHFDALTLAPVQALVFDAQALRLVCDRNPEIGYKLTRSYSHLLFQRLQATREQLLAVYRQQGT